MAENTIYKDEYIHIFTKSDGVYIEASKAGFSVDKLYNILSSHPQIAITNFSALRDTINTVSRKAQKFGELKDKIELYVTPDDLKATVVFNMSTEELDMKNRKNLVEQVASILKKNGIVFGIKAEILEGNIIAGKEYVIAEGIPPVDGKDCVIKMYELKDTKPEIDEEGKVNFYELKLINRVKTGDWLGERIEATDGIPGRSIKDAVLHAKNGKNIPLNYDKNTVQEIYDNNRTTLFSKTNGAVTYNNGRISVSNHLEVDGNVDLSTGNIRFDGYLTVSGTVLDGFSVVATKDIEINSEMGLGNVKEITSTEGSIYIKGGIAAKYKVQINAKNNIYTKFADNAILTCGGSAHIGYFAINSIINAREIIFDSLKGQVIGGHIKADYRVQVPIAGSEIEVKTNIEVTGFNRFNLVKEYDDTLRKIEQLRKQLQEQKNKLSEYGSQKNLDHFQRRQYSNILEKLFETNEDIKNLEQEKKNLAGLLKTRGEGEISITKRIYPNCTLILKNKVINITSVTLPTCYFIQDNEVKVI